MVELDEEVSVPLEVDASTVEERIPGEGAAVAVAVRMLHYLAVWDRSVAVRVAAVAVEVLRFLYTHVQHQHNYQ